MEMNRAAELFDADILLSSESSSLRDVSELSEAALAQELNSSRYSSRYS